LVDYYHVCEYLADASESCMKTNPSAWFKKKKRLKNNDYQRVIDDLFPFIEEDLYRRE
jgi:hypothetical protein